MIILTRKVKFWSVYGYRRFDYVMVISALLIIGDFAIRRRCGSVSVIVRHVRWSWLASVHVQGSVAVSTLHETSSWLAVLLHQIWVNVHFLNSFHDWLLSSGYHLLRSSLVHKRLSTLKPFHKVGFLMNRVFLVMKAWYTIVLIWIFCLYDKWLLATKVGSRVGIEVKIWHARLMLYRIVSILESYRTWLAHSIQIHFLNLLDALFLEFWTLNNLAASISYTLLLIWLPLFEFDL